MLHYNVPLTGLGTALLLTSAAARLLIASLLSAALWLATLLVTGA
jgi:hypothetical protein